MYKRQHQQGVDGAADGKHKQGEIVPSQHPAHVIKIDRNIGNHNNGCRISVLSTKTGSGEQDSRQHHQKDDAGRIDG